MNWLERARREIQENCPRPTAITAERNLTAVMAVPHSELYKKLTVSIGSNGSTALKEHKADLLVAPRRACCDAHG